MPSISVDFGTFDVTEYEKYECRISHMALNKHDPMKNNLIHHFML